MGERLEPLISEDRIRERAAALAHMIDSTYADERLHLVVVLKGAFIFAADLLRRMTVQAAVDFVGAASYGAGTTSSSPVALAGFERVSVGGRHVLVIEDILDTGRTSAAILDRLQAQHPASLALCALLRKPAAASLDLPVFAVGFDIADEFVVGYGMDYAERYRNLRGIYRLALD